METITRSLDDLLVFHAVATQGSFTRAAEALGCSKALVSKQIKRLETRLRTLLFKRTTRSLLLTEQGALLLTYSRKVCELSDEATRRLRDAEQDATGVIKLTAPITLGELVFPDLIRDLRVKLPQVKFELDLTNDNRDFARDRIDFALRGTDEHEPDLIARYVGHLRDAICASPDYMKRSKPGPVSLTDPKSLADHECVLNSHESKWNTWTFRDGSRDLSVEVTGSFATNQYPMARSLGLQGIGIVRLPAFLVAAELERGELVQLFPRLEISTHPIYLVYARNEYAPRKHRVVKEALLGWFRRNSAHFTRPAT